MHDLDRVRQRSRFVAAISPDTGGSGNPYYKSAKGKVRLKIFQVSLRFVKHLKLFGLIL